MLIKANAVVHVTLTDIYKNLSGSLFRNCWNLIKKVSISFDGKRQAESHH